MFTNVRFPGGCITATGFANGVSRHAARIIANVTRGRDATPTALASRSGKHVVPTISHGSPSPAGTRRR